MAFEKDSINLVLSEEVMNLKRRIHLIEEEKSKSMNERNERENIIKKLMIEV